MDVLVHSFWFRICMRLLPFLTMSSWNHWYWYQPMIPPGPWSSAQWKCYVIERLGIKDDDEMQYFEARMQQKGLLNCQWWQLWSNEEWDDHIWRWSQKEWHNWRESLKRKSNSSRPSKWHSFFRCLRPSWKMSWKHGRTP